MIWSSPLSWKRFILLSLSEKKSSPKAGMASRVPESIMPNILGIIQRRGKMEGTSIESDRMRSLGAPLEVPEELSFLMALELELELCCCCMADDEDDSSIFISCSAFRQKF